MLWISITPSSEPFNTEDVTADENDPIDSGKKINKKKITKKRKTKSEKNSETYVEESSRSKSPTKRQKKGTTHILTENFTELLVNTFVEVFGHLFNKIENSACINSISNPSIGSEETNPVSSDSLIEIDDLSDLEPFVNDTDESNGRHDTDYYLQLLIRNYTELNDEEMYEKNEVGPIHLFEEDTETFIPPLPMRTPSIIPPPPTSPPPKSQSSPIPKATSPTKKSLPISKQQPEEEILDVTEKTINEELNIQFRQRVDVEKEAMSERLNENLIGKGTFNFEITDVIADIDRQLRCLGCQSATLQQEFDTYQAMLGHRVNNLQMQKENLIDSTNRLFQLIKTQNKEVDRIQADFYKLMPSFILSSLDKLQSSLKSQETSHADIRASIDSMKAASDARDAQIQKIISNRISVSKNIHHIGSRANSNLVVNVRTNESVTRV